MNAIPRLRPMNIGDMFDTAFRLYRAHFLTFIGIVALLQVPMMILQFVVQFWLGSDMMEEVIRFSAGSARIRPGQSPFENFPIGAFIAFYAITIGLSLIQYLIIQNLINGALAKAIARSYLSEPTSILEAYNFGVRRFFSLLGASLAPFGIVILFSGVLTACSIGLLTTLGVRAGERPNVGLIILAALGLIGALIGLGLVSLWIYTRLIATTPLPPNTSARIT